MLKWAVIPSCCRPVELAELVSSLVADDVDVVVVDTGYPEPWSTYHGRVSVLRDADGEKNISRWWNTGLQHVADWIATYADGEEYCVAVLNDDIRIPDKFVTQLAEALDEYGTDVAYPDQFNSGTQRYDAHRAPGLYYRMSGYAFCLRGSAGIFADETIKWWYGDDDIEWQARRGRGTVCVGNLTVQHLYPSSTTVGELAEQAGRDRVTFETKWRGLPW